jgi:ketosteroid isomerase-like protein
MNLACAAFCLASWMAPASTDLIRVDWSVASNADTPIAAVRREYVTAVNARAASVGALYTTDALGIFTDGERAEAVAGRQPSTNDPGEGAATVTLVPRRFVISGDTGSETGTFVETLRAPERSMTVEGMYVTIYARDADGRWRIAMEVRTRGGRQPLAAW